MRLRFHYKRRESTENSVYPLFCRRQNPSTCASICLIAFPQILCTPPIEKSPRTIKSSEGIWRGEEDLNLRTGLTVTRFPIVRLKPLSHLRMQCLPYVASNIYNIKKSTKNQVILCRVCNYSLQIFNKMIKSSK